MSDQDGFINLELGHQYLFMDSVDGYYEITIDGEIIQTPTLTLIPDDGQSDFIISATETIEAIVSDSFNITVT